MSLHKCKLINVLMHNYCQYIISYEHLKKVFFIAHTLKTLTIRLYNLEIAML